MAATNLGCSGASGLHKLHCKHLRMQLEWTPSASPYSSIRLSRSKPTRPALRSHQGRTLFWSPSPVFKTCTQQPGRFSRAAREVCAIAIAEEASVSTSVPVLVSGIEKKPLVKVCGVTSPEDAAMAAKAGADLIGMAMSPGSERYVTVEQAAQISAAAKENGAQPVAVFVEENAADITRACAAADVSIAQLHGDGARGALGDLSPDLMVVYVLHAEADGTIRTPLPETVGGLIRTSESQRVPGGEKKEQRRAEKRRKREERMEEKWAKIERKEEERRNELAQGKDERRAAKAERDREAANRKEEERELGEYVRGQEEFYEERENRWKGFDAKETKAEAGLMKLEFRRPLAYIECMVKGSYFKLLYRLGLYNRGMSVAPKWYWEYRKMWLDAQWKVLGVARTMVTSRESLHEARQSLEEWRGILKRRIDTFKQFTEFDRRADQRDAEADEMDREMDEVCKQYYDLRIANYKLDRETYQARRNEAMLRTEGKSAPNTSIKVLQTDCEAGSSNGPGIVEWLLVDRVLVGSEEAPNDWTSLQVPQGLSRRGWLLAGGLDPTNVAAALGAAGPDGVDVSSGVVGLDNMMMDKAKVEAFIRTVKSSAVHYPGVDVSSTD